MLHDSAVSLVLEGSFRRESQAGKEKGCCRKVGDRRLRSGEERKDVIWTLLQSGPFQLWAEKDVPRL